MMKWLGVGALALLAVAGVVARGVTDSGTANRADRGTTLTSRQASPIKERRVTNRPANRMGSVMVLMYHRIGPEEKYMVRSYKKFRQDLELLYKRGYRPVTLHEYASNQMKLPRGAMPVVITFDDSHPTQFGLLKNGQPDPNSAVGIWRKFAATRPDFPVKATWFILPNGPFGDRKTGRKKVQMLLDWGSEIGSHTMSHTSLRKLDDEGVKRELARSYEFIASFGVTPRSFAAPYGVWPKNAKLLQSFTWKGKRYGYDNAVLAGAQPAPSPLSPRFDRHKIPRVLAYGGSYGIKDWVQRAQKNQSRPFVQP